MKSRASIGRRRALAAGLAVLGLPYAKLQAAGPTFPPAAGLSDAAEAAHPSAVWVGGWLGERIGANAAVRLRNVDTEPLLAGFRVKPGSHPWIGEHVGKWLHAAALACAYSGDPALRAKLDRVAAELIAAQEADGYLGTYLPAQRFGLFAGADWDVWSHKYCLIGLLAYHRYTGSAEALAAARRAADLLIATFPAKRSILAAGTHQGMAATSVLEPIVLLYRATGDPRYLAFARYIVASWDEDKGPAIVKTLLEHKRVDRVANAKAYEMLSNLVGLCELARVTGERAWIAASLYAWQDIVDKRLYPTGTTSQWENFQPDHDMRCDVMAHIGETCVTTTWIQFNLSLLLLTGEARFGDELERSFYNHLAAAQHPRGDDWCYYTALEGRKHYDAGITCCHSSGPRGLALAPLAAYLRARADGRDQLRVNTFETSRATMALGGESVTVLQQSGFPHRGESRLTFRLARPATFAVAVRVPPWARPMTIAGATERQGWAELPARRWKDGDTVAVGFTLASAIVPADHGKTGRASVTWGPFALAYEEGANPALPAPHLVAIAAAATMGEAARGRPLRFRAEVVAPAGGSPREASLLTFADAGADGGVFRVWLRAPGATPPPGDSLLIGGRESRSRAGGLPGSIIDEDYESPVDTRDGRDADEDWFAVALDRPATARRFVYTHGRTSRDGGWFDARAGGPKVQIQRPGSSAWETLGELAGYPATTATDPKGVGNPWDGLQYALKLDRPVTFAAVRVIGRPACGDDPRQAHASCAELQAFAL